MSEIDDILFGTPPSIPSGGGSEISSAVVSSSIEKYSNQFGVDSALIKALVTQESGGKTDAESYKGALGTMQIMPATAEGIAAELGETYSPDKLYDPDTNIRWGTYLLSTHLKEFGDEERALAAYHAGAGAVRRANEQGLNIPDTDDGLITTSDYVAAILGRVGDDFKPSTASMASTIGKDEILSTLLGVPTFEEPRKEVGLFTVADLPAKTKVPKKEEPAKVKPGELPEKAESIFAQAMDEKRILTPEEVVESMADLDPIFTGVVPGTTTGEEQELADYIAKTKKTPEQAKEDIKLARENKKKLLEIAIDIGDESLIGKVSNYLAAFGGGARDVLTKAIPGGEALLGEEGEVFREVLGEKHPILTGIGSATAFISMALAGGSGVSGALSKTAISKSPTAMSTLTRILTAGGVAATQQEWQENFEQSLKNTLQAAGAGAVSVIPEVLGPANAWQLIAQPLADLIYDVGIGKIRGQDVGSVEWWKQEVMNLAIAAGFAIRDVASGNVFKAEQLAQRKELGLFKGKEIEIVPIKETTPEGLDVGIGGKERIEQRVAAEKAKEKAKEEAKLGTTKLIEGEDEAEFKVAKKFESGMEIKGKKRPEITEAELAKTSEPTKEDIAKEKERVAKEPKIDYIKGKEIKPRDPTEQIKLSESTSENIKKVKKSLSRDSLRDLDKATDDEAQAFFEKFDHEETGEVTKLSEEKERVDFASGLQRSIKDDIFKLSGTRDEAVRQWNHLIDSPANMPKADSFSPEVEKYLNKIAKRYNAQKIIHQQDVERGLSPSEHSRVLLSEDNWNADAVRRLIIDGYYAKRNLQKYHTEWDVRSRELQGEYQAALDDVTKLKEAIQTRDVELAKLEPTEAKEPAEDIKIVEEGIKDTDFPFGANVEKPEVTKPVEIDEFERKRGFTSIKGGTGEKQFKVDVAKEKGDVAKTQSMFDQQRTISKDKFGNNKEKFIDKFMSRFVDRAAPIKKRLLKNEGGKKVVIHHDLVKGASGEAVRSYEVAEKDIWQTIPHKYENVFDDFIQAHRTIEVENLHPDIKSPGGLTGKQMNKWLNELKTQQPELYKNLETARKKYFDSISKKVLNEYVGEGIMTRKFADKLLSDQEFYSPRKFIQHIDPDSPNFDNQGRQINVPDSGLNKLDKGSEEALLNNARLNLANILARSKSRVFKNRANKSLLEFAKDNPENEIGVKVEEAIHRKIKILDAESMVQNLQGLKTELQLKLDQPLSPQQFKNIIEKIDNFDSKIEELVFAKSVSEIDTDVKITELQKRIIDLNNELRIPKELRPRTKREGLLIQEKINNLEKRISTLLRKPKTNQIATDIKTLERRIEVLKEKTEQPLTGNQIESLKDKIQTTNKKIDKFSNLISTAKSEGLSEIKLMSKKLKKIPGDMVRIQAMVGGEAKPMLMPKEMAQYWVTGDPAINSNLAKFISIASGSAILKPMATGINPGFALSNMPRDIVHSWFVTQEYSPILPVAWVQQAADFARVAKDVFATKGRVTEAVKEGISMDFLTQQGQIRKKPWEPQSATGESIQQLGKFLGWANEKSELWTRMALRERAIINKKSSTEATHIARNYIDFAQGGTWTKAADNAIPYLNAGVQGTRGIFRAFKENPKVASFKAAQVMGLGFALAYWNQLMNKDADDAISDREKSNKFTITTPHFWLDKDGNQRHVYFAISKDQGQRVFATIGEELAAMVHGKGFNFERLKMSATDFIPVNLQSFLPPTISALLGYTFNKDFWKNEDIWKGRKGISPKEEYWNTTPKPWMMFGKHTGLSPERSRRAFNKVVPQNLYTYLMEGFAGQFYGNLDDKDKAKISEPFIKKATESPVLKRIVRSTYPVQTVGDELFKKANKLLVDTQDKRGEQVSAKELKSRVRKAEKDQGNKRIKNDRDFDFLSTIAVSGNADSRIEFSNAMRALRKSDPNEYRRVFRRIRNKNPRALKHIRQ